MIRMRTIKDTVIELKQLDPKTAVTEYAVRQLVITDKIAYVKVGNKYLVNFDSLLEYFSGSNGS